MMTKQRDDMEMREDEWEDEFCPICDEDPNYLGDCYNPDCPYYETFSRWQEEETDIYH